MNVARVAGEVDGGSENTGRTSGGGVFCIS